MAQKAPELHPLNRSSRFFRQSWSGGVPHCSQWFGVRQTGQGAALAGDLQLSQHTRSPSYVMNQWSGRCAHARACHQ